MSQFLSWGSCTDLLESTRHKTFSSSIFLWLKLRELCLMARSVCYRQVSLPFSSCHFLCKYCSCHHLSGQYYDGINLKHNLFPFSLSRKVQSVTWVSGAVLQRLLAGLLYPTEKIITKSEGALGLFGYRTGFCPTKWYFNFCYLNIAWDAKTHVSNLFLTAKQVNAGNMIVLLGFFPN